MKLTSRSPVFVSPEKTGMRIVGPEHVTGLGEVGRLMQHCCIIAHCLSAGIWPSVLRSLPEWIRISGAQ
jgi:hypothetical protein